MRLISILVLSLLTGFGQFGLAADSRISDDPDRFGDLFIDPPATEFTSRCIERFTCASSGEDAIEKIDSIILRRESRTLPNATLATGTPRWVDDGRERGCAAGFEFWAVIYCEN